MGKEHRAPSLYSSQSFHGPRRSRSTTIHAPHSLSSPCPSRPLGESLHRLYTRRLHACFFDAVVLRTRVIVFNAVVIASRLVLATRWSWNQGLTEAHLLPALVCTSTVERQRRRKQQLRRQHCSRSHQHSLCKPSNHDIFAAAFPLPDRGPDRRWKRKKYIQPSAPAGEGRLLSHCRAKALCILSNYQRLIPPFLAQAFAASSPLTLHNIRRETVAHVSSSLPLQTNSSLFSNSHHLCSHASSSSQSGHARHHCFLLSPQTCCCNCLPGCHPSFIKLGAEKIFSIVQQVSLASVSQDCNHYPSPGPRDSWPNAATAASQWS